MKTRRKCILIVDDDPPIQRILRRNLMMSGYDVLIAEDGKEAVEIVRMHQPDLILLDLWLPGEIDGLGVCRRVRQWTQTPIIVLSARKEEKQKVEALDLGADDYLTKPFSNDELQARVRACLRRATGTAETENQRQPDILQTEDGYLSMNTARRQVLVRDHEVKLTPTEFELLRQLMLHAGKVLTHRVLLRSVWGPEYGEEADYLRVYVRQLRVKVEETPSNPRYIITEPGVGYVFQAQVRTPQQTGTSWSEKAEILPGEQGTGNAPGGAAAFTHSSSNDISALVSSSLPEAETG
ncbi:MAG TPA: response regulator transcription factor [Ktedonobacteraceae bacterium]|jgi:two-component system KDP operon response regulator KdpE|nr:response regulator transcription factor [Ktedonobacteraceae bacterium]